MSEQGYQGPERRKSHSDHLEQAITEAVAAGIRQAVSDPAMWDAAGKAMREQAQTAAGGWLIGGLRAVLTRAAWVVVIVAGVYALGGWGAVVALIKGQATTP